MHLRNDVVLVLERVAWVTCLREWCRWRASVSGVVGVHVREEC